MTPVLLLLSNGLPDGAWHVDDFDSLHQSLIESFGYRVVVVDLEPDGDSERLLAGLATRLGFSDRFAGDWNGLHAALSDVVRRWNDGGSPDTAPVDLVVLRSNVGRPTAGSTAGGEPNGVVATTVDIFSQVATESGLCVLAAGRGAGVERVPSLTAVRR